MLNAIYKFVKDIVTGALDIIKPIFTAAAEFVPASLRSLLGFVFDVAVYVTTILTTFTGNAFLASGIYLAAVAVNYVCGRYDERKFATHRFIEDIAVGEVGTLFAGFVLAFASWYLACVDLVDTVIWEVNKARAANREQMTA